MDTLTFLASIVSSLAWPAALVAAVILLRKELKGLLRILKKLKAGPVEAEFERQVQELRQEVEVQPELRALPLTNAQLPLMELAASHPRAAILGAWRELESNLRRVASKLGLQTAAAGPWNISATIRSLGKDGRLSQEALTLFQELRVLRNRAAHEDDVNLTYEAAANFVEMAARLSARISAAGL